MPAAVVCVMHAVCATDDSKELARVGPGQCFGELALLSGDSRAANVMALDHSEVRNEHALHQVGNCCSKHLCSCSTAFAIELPVLVFDLEVCVPLVGG